MQLFFQVFLALLFAHVLGDFPLQSGRMVRGKIGFKAGAFLRHSLMHLLLAAASILVFTPLLLREPATATALLLLAGGHLVLDLGKSAVIRRNADLDGALLYIADQLLHVALVAVAAAVAVQAVPPAPEILAFWNAVRDVVLVYAVVIVATVFPAGYLIRYLLRPLSRQLAASRDYQTQHFDSLEGLSNAGLYLGWLERGLLVIAFAMGSFTAVGLIIGAKSVARFPEFKSRAFAEYFLIGTLISVAIAAVGGWALHTILLLVH
ncbi:MAG TPA: DUF3307 domain-containing protein [Woeseiaceae bacterium]|nr:DUF3307 domain-containing protein [Woeseiaceae bacterium]